MIAPLKRWLSGKVKNAKKIISAKRHKISPDNLPKYAIQTIEQLHKRGYEAYIVGGAVRDILLGFHPKDIDIATNATPEEVRRVFQRKARIIGRRFRIVHIYFRSRHAQSPDILEVSTFRADGETSANETLVRNDIYGNAEEDARRRDFTINGLFYDPSNGNVIDYIGGYADIRRQIICMIGAPKKRLPEDPVRVLRAIRLANKLGLTLDKKLEKSLSVYAPLLADIPYSRLFDELVKVLKSGASARVLQQWRHYDISRHIMPALHEANPFFFSALAENDRRLSEGRPTSVTFAIAALFWPTVAASWQTLRRNGESSYTAMETAIADNIFSDNRIVPQRLAARAKDLYFLQARMEEVPNKRRAASILNNESFERALAFAAIRQDDGAAQTASWWSQYAQGDKKEQERMLALLPRLTGRRRRKKRSTEKTD